MSKQTPGPWEHKKDGDEWRIWQKGSVKKVFGGTTKRPVCEVVNTLADARLIAAAPDLLEVLESLFEIGDVFGSAIEHKDPNYQSFDEWADKARSAITKARGK